MNYCQFTPNLSSQINHELRIPISAIIGLITFLQETELTEEQKDYLHDIEESANRLLNAQIKISRLVQKYMI